MDILFFWLSLIGAGFCSLLCYTTYSMLEELKSDNLNFLEMFKFDENSNLNKFQLKIALRFLFGLFLILTLFLTVNCFYLVFG